MMQIKVSIMTLVVLLVVANFACSNATDMLPISGQPTACEGEPIKHISEEQIQKLSPDSRLRLMVSEQMYHVYDMNDENFKLLHHYLIQDGVKIVPTASQYLEEYDPQSPCKEKQAAQLLTATIYLTAVDSAKIRLRSNEIGKRAIENLEKAIERRRSSKKSDDKNNTIFDTSVEQIKGKNIKDGLIQKSLEEKFGVKISDGELLQFIEYLISLDPEYPGWTKVVGWSEMSDDEAERYLKAYNKFTETKLF